MFQEYCKKLQNSGNAIEWNDMKDYLKANLGLYGAISVDEKDDKAIHDAFVKTFKTKETEEVETLYLSYNKFAEIVFNTFNMYTGLGWTTTGHTGDFVPVFAVGAGAEIFGGVQNNIDIPKKIAKLAGVKF